jgi:tetratricopeptide (TPR) repeat protein
MELIFIPWILWFAVTTTPSPQPQTSIQEDRYKVVEQAPAIKKQVEQERTERVEAILAFTLGKRLEEEGKLEESLKNYQRALEMDPDYTPIKIAMSQVLYALDRNDEALKILEAVPPTSPEVTSLLAWGYLKKEKKSERVVKLIDTAFEQIKNDSSQDATDYLKWGFRLALILLKCQDISSIEIAKKLLPVFEKAATFDTRNPQVQLLAAEIALHADNYEKALFYYEKVSKLAPSSTNVQQRLALFFALTDQKEKAIKILEGILEEKPDQRTRLFISNTAQLSNRPDTTSLRKSICAKRSNWIPKIILL